MENHFYNKEVVSSRFIYCVLFLSFLSCTPKSFEAPPVGALPEVAKSDEEKFDNFSKELVSHLEELDIDSIELLPLMSLVDDVAEPEVLKPSSMSGVLEWLAKLATPKHIKKFSSAVIEKHSDKPVFLNFLGTYAGCYQFRLFYKYQDPAAVKVEWASSLLTIPSRSDRAMKQKTAVVLAPTLDGFTPLLEPGFWGRLCKKKLASLMPESVYQKNAESQWEKLHFDPSPDPLAIDDFGIFERSLQRYVLLLEKNFDFLKNLNQLPTTMGYPMHRLNVMPVLPERVGIWASSLGSFATTVVLGRNPQIKAGVLSVGGGGLPYILSRSKIEVFAETRKQHMQYLNYKSISQYESFLARHISTDPINYAPLVDRSKVHLFLANKDKSVPTKSQYDLWRAYGSPSYKSLPGGHIGSLLRLAWLGRRTTGPAVDFMIKKLTEESLD